jgi:hypothetical protein
VNVIVWADLTSNSVTELPPSFATQTWVPSDETPEGLPPTPIVWTTEPSDAFNSVTELTP